MSRRNNHYKRQPTPSNQETKSATPNKVKTLRNKGQPSQTRDRRQRTNLLTTTSHTTTQRRHTKATMEEGNKCIRTKQDKVSTGAIKGDISTLATPTKARPKVFASTLATTRKYPHNPNTKKRKTKDDPTKASIPKTSKTFNSKKANTRTTNKPIPPTNTTKETTQQSQHPRRRRTRHELQQTKTIPYLKQPKGNQASLLPPTFRHPTYHHAQQRRPNIPTTSQTKRLPSRQKQQLQPTKEKKLTQGPPPLSKEYTNKTTTLPPMLPPTKLKTYPTTPRATKHSNETSATTTRPTIPRQGSNQIPLTTIPPKQARYRHTTTSTSPQTMSTRPRTHERLATSSRTILK